MKRLLHNSVGAGAAEFALVLPLLLVTVLGVIDAGRYMWSINRAEKAAQMGVRMAIVTDPVSAAINDNYIGKCSPALKAGDAIPSGCFTTITCSKPGAGAATCSSGGANNSAFKQVVDRMQLFMPEISDSSVQIIYSPSGLGYAGNPSGPDLAPIVTVSLSDISFDPIMLFTLASIDLPEVHSSLTFEDGIGSQSN